MEHNCCSHDQHTPAESAGKCSAPLFPDAEIAAFKADDKHTAAAIVGLMVGIFTLGLILYSVIALWVA
jgi:hypothetical protein